MFSWRPRLTAFPGNIFREIRECRNFERTGNKRHHFRISLKVNPRNLKRFVQGHDDLGPPVIKQNHDSYSIVIGKPVILYCNFTANRRQASVMWEKIGNKLRITVNTYPENNNKYDGGTVVKALLTIKNANQSDSGKDLCTAANGEGAGSISVLELFVRPVYNANHNPTLEEVDKELSAESLKQPALQPYSELTTDAESVSSENVHNVDHNKTLEGVDKELATEALKQPALQSDSELTTEDESSSSEDDSSPQNNFEGEIRRKEELLKEKKKSIELLNEQIIYAHDKMNNVEKDIESKYKDLKTLSGIFKAQESTLKTCKDDLASTTRELHQTTERYKRMSDELEAQRQELEEICVKFSSLQVDHRQKEETIEQLKTELHTVRESHDNYKKEIEVALETKRQELEEINVNFSSLEEDHRKKEEQLLTELNTVRESHDKYKKQIEVALENKRQELEEININFSSLEEEHRKKEETIKQLTTELHTVLESHDKYKKQIEVALGNLQDKLQLQETTITIKEDDLKSKKLQLDNLQENIQNLEGKIQQLSIAFEQTNLDLRKETPEHKRPRIVEAIHQQNSDVTVRSINYVSSVTTYPLLTSVKLNEFKEIGKVNEDLKKRTDVVRTVTTPWLAIFYESNRPLWMRIIGAAGAVLTLAYVIARNSPLRKLFGGTDNSVQNKGDDNGVVGSGREKDAVEKGNRSEGTTTKEDKSTEHLTTESKKDGNITQTRSNAASNDTKQEGMTEECLKEDEHGLVDNKLDQAKTIKQTEEKIGETQSGGKDDSGILKDILGGWIVLSFLNQAVIEEFVAELMQRGLWFLAALLFLSRQMHEQQQEDVCQSPKEKQDLKENKSGTLAADK